MEELLANLSDDNLDALLARALAGEASAEEMVQLRRWLDDRGVHLSQAMLPGGVDALAPMPRIDKKGAWAAVLRELRGAPDRDVTAFAQVDRHSWRSQRSSDEWRLEGSRRFKAQALPGTPWIRAVGRPWQRWLGAAGALAMVMAIIGIVRGNMPLSWDKSDITLPSVTYVTAKGERATITLPDGATVALNVASRLEVPVDYASGNHTVRLIGEGLFTVPHHDRHPLIVQAETTTARVLGTSFLVRHYASDTNVVVAVREGKVAVEGTVVTPHWAVAVGRDRQPRLQPSQDAAFTFAVGVLTLNGLPLPDAIVELDRWYNADIRLGDPALANEHVKGEFEAGSLTDLAAILELTFNVRAVRDGRVLTLYPR